MGVSKIAKFMNVFSLESFLLYNTPHGTIVALMPYSTPKLVPHPSKFDPNQLEVGRLSSMQTLTFNYKSNVVSLAFLQF